jgi:long-chain acyl-CoA synthetase
VSGGVGDQVKAIAAEVFNVPVSTLTQRSTPDNTNGWDSLAHMTFVTALESRFAFRMSPREIMSLSSLSDAERSVHRALDSPRGRSAGAELQDHDRM